jgi:hypothetical protein
MKFMDTFFNSGRKPLIAMVHLPPLPTTPLYDERQSMTDIIEQVRADLAILLVADFDAYMFCNEGDRPYSFTAGYEGVAAMTTVVSQLAPKDRPFGVDFLWDSRAALAIAAATGASFIRGVMTGAYESDMGLWSTDVAGMLRERRRLRAENVAFFMNVTPEFSSSVGTRSLGAIATSAVMHCLADAILISGPVQGAEPDLKALAGVKSTLKASVPVMANTGAKSTNLPSFLESADGIIVGTDLKRDGYTWNKVDAQRVEAFMKAAGRRMRSPVRG